MKRFNDYTVKVWDVTTGAYFLTFEGYGGGVWSGARRRARTLSTLKNYDSRVSSVAFSPDGSRLTSGSSDYTVKVWDAATGACLSTLEGYGDRVSLVAFSPDRSRLTSGSRDKTVKVWDAATGAYLSTLKGHGG
ncbi:hypothetical protein DL765_008975 [Monosporascus sp. GIB2]|nr:hypothetical protein DL765_008975 [Monosporascus sp. GIB2]